MQNIASRWLLRAQGHKALEQSSIRKFAQCFFLRADYIQFTDVHYGYETGHDVLRGVNFRITHGEKVALLGRNGAGKSTLLWLTNGLLMPTSGEVNIGDVPLTRKTLPLIRQSVGMVFQNADDQLFMPTVEEDVAFGPMNMKLPKDEVTRRVLKALEDVGATQLARRQPSTLSGGEKKRAAVATVLSMETSILVMDEPTSGLDAVGQRQLVDVVNVWDGRTENLLADSETLRHYNLEPLRLAQ